MERVTGVVTCSQSSIDAPVPIEPIGLFTPICYGDLPKTKLQRAGELADSYFYLGGRKAVVVRVDQTKKTTESHLQTGSVPFLEKALKVASWSTVVIPLVAITAKCTHRAKYNHKLECKTTPTPPPRLAPIPQKPTDSRNPTGDNERPLEKAPLIIIRSQSPTEMKVSISYTPAIAPIEPIVPKPTSITPEGGVLKYTWDVLTHKDGTMTSKLVNGTTARIHMIWWEAVRKGELLSPVNPAKSVCIKASHLREFLQAYLAKSGVSEKESEAFIAYWTELFKSATSYLLIQPIEKSELSSYLPELQIESSSATSFNIERPYFRFQPTEDPVDALNAESYLEALPIVNLGDNAVIDLGGEIAGSREVVGDARWNPPKAFNDSFAETYVYATEESII